MLSGVRRPSVMPAGSDPLAPWLAERLGVAWWSAAPSEVAASTRPGACGWRMVVGLFAKTNHSPSLALLEAKPTA
jgi:hypothetical protein